MRFQILYIALFLFIHNSYSQNLDSISYKNIDSLNDSKISVHGYLDTYYGYDFSKPENFDRSYSVSSSRHNEFNINLAYLDVKYVSKKVRGRIAPSFGTYMNSNYASEKGTFKNLLEANAGICLSLKKNIWMDAGILSSPFTNETAISKDQLMYTRSFAAEYSPYYLSGVKLSYPINKKITTYFYIINGWQQINDLNKSKSLATQIEYHPNDNFLINWDTYIGDEKSIDNKNFKTRFFTDLYFVYDKGGRCSFTSCSYIGFQKLKDSLDVPSNVFWWQSNFSGLIKLKNNVSLAGRIEYFSDPNAIQIHPITSAIGFSSYSGGLCLNVKISKNAMFRVEDRIYYSDQKVYFDRNNKESNTSNLLIGSLAVWF